MLPREVGLRGASPDLLRRHGSSFSHTRSVSDEGFAERLESGGEKVWRDSMHAMAQIGLAARSLPDILACDRRRRMGTAMDEANALRWRRAFD